MPTKTILVTGANRGIGFAIVHLLAKRAPDNTIILACRSSQKANDAIDQLKELGLKANFHALELDVADDDSIHNAVASVDQKFGGLDGMLKAVADCATIYS